MHVPIALESDLYWNDRSLGFELLPRAREPLVAVPDEVVGHLPFRGDPQRAQGADRRLTKGQGWRRNARQRRSEPCIRQSPTSAPSHATRGHDAPLEPEERQR